MGAQKVLVEAVTAGPGVPGTWDSGRLAALRASFHKRWWAPTRCRIGSEIRCTSAHQGGDGKGQD